MNTTTRTASVFFLIFLFYSHTAQSQYLASSQNTISTHFSKSIRLEWDRNNQTGSPLPSNNSIAFKLLSAVAQEKISPFWSTDLKIPMTSNELYNKLHKIISNYNLDQKQASSNSFSSSAITNLTGLSNLDAFKAFCDELHFTLALEKNEEEKFQSLTLIVNRESTYHNQEILLGSFSFTEMRNSLVMDIPDEVWNDYIAQIKTSH